MTTKFLYMDEQYVDPRTHRGGGEGSKRRPCTCLTGVLIPTGVHRVFRDHFYRNLGTALGFEKNVIPQIPFIHASNLLPGADDEVKFRFMENVVALAVDLELKLYRIGYFETPQLLAMVADRKGILSLCFSGMLCCLKDELMNYEVWPVMETDQSPEQDRLFAGYIQHMDFVSALVGQHALAIDNGNLGELHYATKRSAYGIVTDCISYILDALFLDKIGIIESAFKQRLAKIAAGLLPLVVFDEIIEMKFENAPIGYIGEGPFRYAEPMTPKAG